MARISLVPQKREFFVLYSRASRNAVEIARLLVRLLEEFPSNSGLLRDIKELEHEGDRLTRELVDLLNRTFVTPFDRDDMYQLSSALDDICDHIDEAAGNISGYGVSQIRPAAKDQAQVILRATEKLREAVERVDGFKNADRQLHELRDLEDEGDRLNREAVSQLVKTEDDAVAIIRLKGIHEALEEAGEACGKPANVLQA